MSYDSWPSACSPLSLSLTIGKKVPGKRVAAGEAEAQTMHIVAYDRIACEIGAHAGSRGAAWAVMSESTQPCCPDTPDDSIAPVRGL